MCDVARPVPASLHDVEALAEMARREGVALAVAGSEEPLVHGAWEAFESSGVPFFGPSGAAARLEGSKCFAKEFMRRAGIPTAAFEVYADFDRAVAALAGREFPLVVKADGLAAGKGVHVVANKAEAEASLRTMLVDGSYGEAGRTVVLEEALHGPEISVFAISDGYTYRVLGVAQDHKRAYDGDRGPNTGGMGAYSPVPGLDPALLQDIESRILAPTLAGMVDEGTPYRGFLYLGLMLTENGPRVLEYNCRLGDPEAQVLLPRLRCDFLELVVAASHGELHSAQLDLDPGAAVGVVVASPGYPELSRTGLPVRGLDIARAKGARVYSSGLRRDGDLWLTTGGRICTVVGQGASLAEARRAAYDAVAQVEIEGAFYRRDIASHTLEGVAWPSRASAS
jgi:phosphoribosylamine--glycine ligase